MRNVNDADAVAAQQSDHTKQILDLAAGQRCSRFIHDQYLRVGSDGFCNFYELLFRHTQSRGDPMRIDRSADAPEQFLSAPVALFPIDGPPEAGTFESERDVFG